MYPRWYLELATSCTFNVSEDCYYIWNENADKVLGIGGVNAELVSRTGHSQARVPVFEDPPSN